MSNFYLKFQDLKDKAEEILSGSGDITSKLPVDIDLLAEHYGFDIIPVPNFKEQITREAFLSPYTKEIYVDQDIYLNTKFESRYRFGIAHEIAHYFLHLEYYKDNIKTGCTIEDWIKIYLALPEDDLELFEYQANVVGGCILIPDIHLDVHFPEALNSFHDKIMLAKKNGVEKEEYIDYVKDGIAQKLAPIFNVSNRAMILRFKDFKYVKQIP